MKQIKITALVALLLLIFASPCSAEWANVYISDADGFFGAQQALQTPDEGYIVVTKRSKVMKLSQDGTIEWIKDYRSDLSDETNAIALTYDPAGNHDGYIVAGQKTATA